jgi:dihydroorotate dehydrogenase (NAD+) catalytic subunit
MHIQIGTLKLKNPVLVASGTFGYAQEFSALCDVKKLGGIITKTITVRPRAGNPSPRVFETASGMLNAVGLQNEGLDAFLDDKLPYLRSLKIPIIVSIGGDSTKEYVTLARKLNTIKSIDALELNISCPNIPGKQKLVSQDEAATIELVKKVRAVTTKTVITKLSPNVSDIVAIAKAAESAGSDAVSLINTVYGMAIDVEKRKPVLGNIVGGLSGPAIKPIALCMVYKTAQSLTIPVIGMGGILNTRDALEFMIAGASAICVGTGNLVDPSCAATIAQELKTYITKHNYKSYKQLVGSLRHE